jgi:hypothetical protein
MGSWSLTTVCAEFKFVDKAAVGRLRGPLQKMLKGRSTERGIQTIQRDSNVENNQGHISSEDSFSISNLRNCSKLI